MIDDDTVLIQEGATISFREDQQVEEKETEGRYRKMLFRYGTFIDAMTGEKDLELTKELAEELKANFEAKAIERVPVPVDHTRDPKANTGELVELEVEDDALYGVLQIRDYEAIYKIEQELIFDVSVKINWNFTDTETGKKWGAIIEHVALVNDPYIEHMTGFEAVLANVADDIQDEYSKGMRSMLTELSTSMSRQYATKPVIMLSINANKRKGGNTMSTVDVKNTRDFDVEVIYTKDDEEIKEVVKAGETVTVPADQEEAVKKQIEEAEKPKEKDDTTEADKETEAAKGEEKETEASKEKTGEAVTTELSKTERDELTQLREEKANLQAEKDYATLSKEGFLVPAQEEAYKAMHKQLSGKSDTIELSKDDKTQVHNLVDAFNGLIRAGGKSIEFSQSGSQKSNGDDKESDTQPLSKQLSKEQLKKLEKDHNITADRIDDLAKKNPKFAEAMLGEIKEEE